LKDGSKTRETGFFWFQKRDFLICTGFDRLLFIMKSTAFHWNPLLKRFARLRVLVIGDMMLDQYIMGRVSRISPEAPVPVVDVQSEKYFPGGASNVARNLRSLSAHVTVLGIVGNDTAGRKLFQLLGEQGIDTRGILTDRSRPTTIKTRIIAHHQQVVRFDRESRDGIAAAIQKQARAFAQRVIPRMDAVIFEDYGKGLLDQDLLDTCIQIAGRARVSTFADPTIHHRLAYRGLTGITPNRTEAFWMAGEPVHDAVEHPLKDTALLQVGRKILRETGIANVLITLGEQGMCLFRKGCAPHHIPTAAQEVFDVSGAGDTAISTFALGIGAGLDAEKSAFLSNLAAGIVVGKAGTATATHEELLARLGDKT
jgi:D-beta-D-heptose 7-phosphate kinase/D-beta-D-heptose 1-phosphate adenosyltransferase